MQFPKLFVAVVTAMLSFGMGQDCSAKLKLAPKMYMYGFSASFNDSVVYFTDVMSIDSAWVDGKTGFLAGRDNYALQMKSYLADNIGQSDRTCVVMFSEKRGALEKDYVQMRKMYSAAKRGNRYDVRDIAATDFKFTHVDVSYELEEPAETPAPKMKAPKKGNRGHGQKPPMPGEAAAAPQR